MSSVIAAIATGAPGGGIGVIRISGKEAFFVTETVFFPASKSKSISAAPGYTALYGQIKDENNDPIDDGIALIFRAPHSYTGEDTVELSVHGGAYVLSRVMSALIAAGARQAQAGEFSKRAFLNGKLDLTAAQAVADTVAAQGEMQLKAATARRNGAAYRRISALRSDIADVLAHAAAWCDFPEEDVEELSDEKLISRLAMLKNGVETLISTADSGIALTGGVRTVIAGKPNVGKSTVMNLLSMSERSIVTDIPGTTRDVVEAFVNVGGITLVLSDTAGLRETLDTVERIGVERSKAALTQGGLVLAVFDGSKPFSSEDASLIKSVKTKNTLFIVNKSDLGLSKDGENLLCDAANAVHISAKDEKCRAVLCEAIKAMLKTVEDASDGDYLSTVREKDAAIRAKRAIDDAIAAKKAGMTLDAVTVCLDDALCSLGEITGESASESVIDKVFENFCVGK